MLTKLCKAIDRLVDLIYMRGARPIPKLDIGYKGLASSFKGRTWAGLRLLAEWLIPQEPCHRPLSTVCRVVRGTDF